MLWLVFCALVLFSPIILFVLLDLARARVAARRPRVRPQYGRGEDFSGVSAALEAQFMLAPLTAIHEAEELLGSARGIPVTPQPLDNGTPLPHLRRSFDELMGEVERSLTRAG